MVNHLGLTQRMNREMEIGTVEPVEVVSPANESDRVNHIRKVWEGSRSMECEHDR